MSKDRVVDSLGRIDDDMIQSVEALRQKKKQPTRTRWGAMVACLCLLIAASSIIAPLFSGVNGDTPFINPLVITVYAADENGGSIPTVLNVGEKVKLYPAMSPYAEDFNGFAFDLTLLDAKYVCPIAVTDDWSAKLYSGDSIEYTGVHWSLTEGDEIYVVRMYEDGTVVRPGEHEFGDPKPHGSEIVWRPNNEGLNRTIINVFDENFELMAQYYLEITEMNGDFYAEIVKIVQ